MPTVFPNAFGTVLANKDPAAAFFLIKTDFDTNNVPIKGIATDVKLELSGNYQFLHTVNNFVYFYAFGDRVGAVNISGFGLITDCTTSAATATPEAAKFMSVYDYYKQNRGAKSGNKAAKLTIGSGPGGSNIVLTGFLTGINMQVSAGPSPSSLGFWTLRFEVIPDPAGTP